MTKTEAAEIVATRVIVVARRRVAEGRKVNIDRMFVAEIMSDMEHSSVQGSLAHVASLTRPDYRTVRTAGRRMLK